MKTKCSNCGTLIKPVPNTTPRNETLCTNCKQSKERQLEWQRDWNRQMAASEEGDDDE